MGDKAKAARRKRKRRDTTPSTPKPELIVGLVGPTGTALHEAADSAAAALSRYGYKAIQIRVSGLMLEVDGADFLETIQHEDERIWEYMNAGDSIRDQTGRNDAMAGLALGWIAEYRAERHKEEEALDTVFILDSLKHPAEIETMRRVYRDRFVLISVHAPTDARRDALKKKIATSHAEPEREQRYSDAAARIMERDEHDDDHGHGQNVREAFVLGDVYISTHPSEKEMDESIARYFRLFFGHPFETPTPDEYAMFQTHTAALRSSDLSRQVGAAVCSKEGEIIAVGCNEVPKPLGGQYWPTCKTDQRDFQLGYDSNAKHRDRALLEAFERLRNNRLLGEEASQDRFMSALKGTRLTNLTEFGRTVHAEMAALLDAARRGTPVAGHRLFTTTFPCHNCARHIIGAGIKEVIYREPYEKSLASELHEDAITVDPATETDDRVVFRRFVGVGPPHYLGLFTKRRRKDDKGNKVEWAEATAEAPLVTPFTAYLTNEDDFLDEIREALKSIQLEKGTANGD